jgi:hypothetical protein
MTSTIVRNPFARTGFLATSIFTGAREKSLYGKGRGYSASRGRTFHHPPSFGLEAPQEILDHLLVLPAVAGRPAGAVSHLNADTFRS